MKTTSAVLSLLILVGSALPASATSYAVLSTPELVQMSDLIAVGLAENEKDKTVLRVSEVLKGDPVEQVTLNRTHIKFNDLVISLGKSGIHFLRREGTGYAPFHPACYKSITEQKAVSTVLRMFTDPGPYLDLTRTPENPDFVYVLGEVFSGWRVTSQEIPSLEKHMTRFADKYYEVGSWVNDQVVTLECESDTSGVVRFTATQPEGPLAEFFKRRLLTASRWPEVKEALTPKFRVTLDARIPKMAGSAKSREAISYLRERLRSTNSEVIAAALLALAKIRDSEAVPLIIPLLEHEERTIQIQAIRFLGWSQSQRAEKPLRELLESHASKYPEDHDLSDPAAVSLLQIGMTESIPSLERAACHGVQRAIEAIGTIGRTASFEIMLEAAKRDPRQNAYMVNAFYWLVRRSNKEIEPWMSNSTWSEKIGVEKIPKWTEWWEKNKSDFKVIKSQQQAIDENTKGGP